MDGHVIQECKLKCVRRIKLQHQAYKMRFSSVKQRLNEDLKGSAILTHT